ncbi:MAG: DUF1579 family protein [Phycisphaerales bacterium]
MKRLAALTLVAFLGACSSPQTTNTANAPSQNNNQHATANTGVQSWNVAAAQKSQNHGTVLSNLDKPTQEWFKSTLPKSEHAELFGSMLGQWNTTMTWSMGPGEQTETSTGTASNTATMQRFVRQEFQGEMFPGMNFQGFALFGYNATTGQYESVWCDNTSTAITTANGTKQQDGSILWTGTFVDPTTGEQKTSKATLSFNGRNTMCYTVWDKDEAGKEFPSLKVDYTRAQTATNTPIIPRVTGVKTSKTSMNNAPVDKSKSLQPRAVAGCSDEEQN